MKYLLVILIWLLAGISVGLAWLYFEVDNYFMTFMMLAVGSSLMAIITMIGEDMARRFLSFGLGVIFAVLAQPWLMFMSDTVASWWLRYMKEVSVFFN